MLSIALLSLLAIRAFALPRTTVENVVSKRSLLEGRATTPDYILACEAASNCATFTDSTGQVQVKGVTAGTSTTSVKVTSTTVEGITYPHTFVTVGDQQIPWGCDLNPVATLGNLSNADMCPLSGMCIVGQASYSQPVGYIAAKPSGTAAAPVPATMTIQAQGTYVPDLRDLMVEAIQGVAGGMMKKDLGQKWEGSDAGTSKRSLSSDDGANSNNHKRDVIPTETTTQGTCDIYTMASSIGVSYYETASSLTASMSAVITLQDPDEGFCGSEGQSILGLAGLIAGATPGGQAVSLGLGAISGVCGIVSSS